MMKHLGPAIAVLLALGTVSAVSWGAASQGTETTLSLPESSAEGEMREAQEGKPDGKEAEPGRRDSGDVVALESRPDRYAIQTGDTLWGISGRFWGDPYFWPRLWSFNPYIENAHFIYPGNILNFSAGSYVRPPSVGVGEGAVMPKDELQETVQSEGLLKEEKACGVQIPFLEKSGTISVYSQGFLREQGFGPIGRVAKAPDPKLMMAERDVLYLKFNRMSDIQCGDVFTIYQPTRKRVLHPIYKRRVIGSLYRILGEVEVVDVNDFIATGKVTFSFGEIERGDLITSRVAFKTDVEIATNPKEIEGYIVESMNQENATLAPNDIVYLDRGEEDGVSKGDAFYVVRQGDALGGLVEKGRRDITLPYQIVGKVVVLRPGEYVSEAVITEANQIIEVGDSITTQVN